MNGAFSGKFVYFLLSNQIRFSIYDICSGEIATENRSFIFQEIVMNRSDGLKKSQVAIP
jgi:hypothetical protein